MYRVLYHGHNHDVFSELRDALPADIRLEWHFDSNRLDETLARFRPHALVFSISQPSPEDLSRLKQIVGRPRAPAVVVTARQLTISQAVCCMKEGAVDCLKEPLSPQILAACLSRMAASMESISETAAKTLFEGNSPPVQDLLRRIRQYAPLPNPVLIRGETGSGKDLAARTLHSLSPRSDGPFVAINCAAYPESLWESELFGSSRGAFTGSVDRPGCFERAHGGTLFLDEIAELNPHGQAGLLRVIEDRQIARLGSYKSKKVDIRIIAATNRNLKESVSEKTFRSDLFYRLNQLSLNIPPLRKRRQDIPKLARTYMAQSIKGKRCKLSGEAIAKLVRYPWPGNVRELQSVLLRASIVSPDGTIRANDMIFD